MGLDSDRDSLQCTAAPVQEKGIDARRGGCRKISHFLSKFGIYRQGKISFYSLRQIEPGEELLIDYGRRYWQGREHLELP
eukprot:scaffold2740_cov418-Prasinococcus_capsulatus_cf.AAC.23